MLLAVAETGVAVGVPAQIERAVRIEGCRGRRRASLGRAVRFARAQASSCSGDGDEARRAEMRKSLSRSWRTNAQGGAGAPGLTYKDAGVDIDAGAELVRRIAAMTPGIGGFGGLFPFGGF